MVKSTLWYLIKISKTTVYGLYVSFVEYFLRLFNIKLKSSVFIVRLYHILLKIAAF